MIIHYKKNCIFDFAMSWNYKPHDAIVQKLDQITETEINEQKNKNCISI